jgi:sugar phosphate isomerase/epimerase
VKTIRGPGIFLAQFMADSAPFNTLESACQWMASVGYVAVQIPSWDSRCIDLRRAAESKTYCDEIKGVVESCGLQITELSTHLQGQLVAVHPAYDVLFDGFAPEQVRGNPEKRTAWAVDQLRLAARASGNLGLNTHATFSGALQWHTFYPWPPRLPGLVSDGFTELARRWVPLLDAFDQEGVDVCYEVHPGEDIHDGVTFERFLEATRRHPRCRILYDPSHLLLQHLDYLQYIDYYHEFIRIFHVKDAEFRPSGKSGVYGGFQSWVDRPGRFRSLGDGQVDFKGIFSKLAQYDYPGWAVVEWECCLKDSQVGAREGAPFVRNHIIPVTARAFDDFAGQAPDARVNRKVLGI